MKKQTSTKRALITSALSVLMCGSMLVGTTFAWFTDTVTSGKNKIVAGNLDVELYYNDAAGEKQPVGKDTELFKVEKWEPGVISYETFTVENVGTLALKYALYLTVGDCNYVATADGKSTGKSLADVIQVAVVQEEKGTLPEITRDYVHELAAKGEFKPLTNVKSSEVSILPSEGENEDKLAVILYWEPNVKNDNDYNMNNDKKVTPAVEEEAEPELFIDFNINLFATQYTYEKDSFNNEYDADAAKDIPTVTVSRPGDLASAINSESDGNNNIALNDDVDVTKGNSESHLTSGIIVDDGKDVNLDGNGNTVTLSHTAFNNYGDLGLEGITSGTLNFKNVNFQNEEEGQNGYVTTLGFNSNANIVFENCTFNGMFSAVYINDNDTGNVTVTFKNCTFTNTAYVCGMGQKELDGLNKDGGHVKVVFEGTVTVDDETVEDPQEVCGW